MDILIVSILCFNEAEYRRKAAATGKMKRKGTNNRDKEAYSY